MIDKEKDGYKLTIEGEYNIKEILKAKEALLDIHEFQQFLRKEYKYAEKPKEIDEIYEEYCKVFYKYLD